MEHPSVVVTSANVLMNLHLIFFILVRLQESFGPGFNLLWICLLFWIFPCLWSSPWVHPEASKPRMLFFPLLFILSGQSGFVEIKIYLRGLMSPLRAPAILFLLLFFLSSTRFEGCMTNSMREFSILNFFGIDVQLPEAQLIKKVSWYPRCVGTIKCNTDGSAKGSHGHVAAGGIFRDHAEGFLGCFSSYIGVQTAFFAEVCWLQFHCFSLL